MLDHDEIRFTGAEEALRFFFRLRELLYGGRSKRLAPDELPADACVLAGDALDDYRSIGWSLRGLDEFALWLLGEVYGPTCFGVHRRTLSHARQAGRREFNRRHLSLREVSLIHERALGVVKRGLRELGMIPVEQVRRIRERRRRLEAAVTREKLQGDRVAVRG